MLQYMCMVRLAASDPWLHRRCLEQTVGGRNNCILDLHDGRL